MITDFNFSSASGDVILVKAKNFGNLSKGSLDEAHFAYREDDNLAQSADGRFIYRNADSTLWFDMDGTGQLPPRLLAQLDPDDTDEEIPFRASHIWVF